MYYTHRLLQINTLIRYNFPAASCTWVHEVDTSYHVLILGCRCPQTTTVVKPHVLQIVVSRPAKPQVKGLRSRLVVTSSLW